MNYNFMIMSKRKRIYNPVTGRYYTIRQRTTKFGRKGQIKGLWKPPKKLMRKSLIDLILGK